MERKPFRLTHTVAQYPVIVQDDESGGYWVTCPTLEGCYSQGETIDQALSNVREAIQLCLEDRETKQNITDVSLHFVRV